MKKASVSRISQLSLVKQDGSVRDRALPVDDNRSLLSQVQKWCTAPPGYCITRGNEIILLLNEQLSKKTCFHHVQKQGSEHLRGNDNREAVQHYCRPGRKL